MDEREHGEMGEEMNEEESEGIDDEDEGIDEKGGLEK